MTIGRTILGSDVVGGLYEEGILGVEDGSYGKDLVRTCVKMILPCI